jgi:phenylpropionate dioxygenase-like ring-hydroxylating dioxygenase large terminal subunit
MPKQGAQDEGTAYGRQKGTYIRELTEVAAGTPMGELLRRYWHPIGLTADASTIPKRVRALGEDLILFRDGQGRPGLVVERCAHRGASLYFGRIEQDGIRCCYHGWLFSAQGHCLDKAVEPNGGVRRAADRQPWYPLEERYGLIFAYMGPPDRKPVLPRYDALEEIGNGQVLYADDSSYAAAGPPVLDFNWFQHYENFQDAGHVIWLHFQHSGPQFGDKHRLSGAKIDAHGFMEGRSWSYTDTGMQYVAEDVVADGSTVRFIVQNILPTVGIVPEASVSDEGRADQVFWLLPIDDTHFRIYAVRPVDASSRSHAIQFKINGKTWEERTPEERRRYPGDYEAQMSQGPITLHSEEHLSATDRGVAMMRRLFKQQLEAVAAGKDPINVSFDQNGPAMKVEAGRFRVQGCQ